jgi:diguanylate cyclase (GGDEF)-like protein
MDMMTSGVRPIADMADIGRMVLFRNYMTPGGLTMSQVYRWDRNSGGSTELNPLYSDIPYARLMPNWETYLKDGHSVNSPVRLLPETEAAILHSSGIVSVAAIPIFMNNNFWGFAIFGDIHNERCFEDDIIEMMRSAAFLFANAFIRADMERETAEKNEFTRVIFEASPIGLTMFDENLNMFDCNNAVLNMFGTTKQCYLEQFLEFSPEYQPDGRKTIDALIDDMGRALSGETLVIEWLHNTLAGEPVPCEITLTHAKYNGKHIGMTYIYDLRNIKNLEKNIKRLETVADKIYYDPLTGIYNRRYFDENLNRIIRFLSRSGGVISLMMIDIDFFKDYNDKYGHSEGDRCLKIVAEILKDTITRTDDFVARYGGDEFVVVMPNTDEQGAKLIANKMLDNIRNCNIACDQGNAANRVTISIGVSTGKAEYTNAVEDLVRNADEMLYKSKEEGRNRCAFGNI